jgi:hypothetical protein
MIVNYSGPSLLAVCNSNPVPHRMKVNIKHVVNYFQMLSRIVLMHVLSCKVRTSNQLI